MLQCCSLRPETNLDPGAWILPLQRKPMSEVGWPPSEGAAHIGTITGILDFTHRTGSHPGMQTGRGHRWSVLLARTWTTWTKARGLCYVLCYNGKIERCSVHLIGPLVGLVIERAWLNFMAELLEAEVDS